MADFRFVHAADLHLDTPFEGVAKADPAVGDALREASLEAWDSLVRVTLDEGAAFLVLAGDIYDGAERGVRAQLRFRRGLERLSAHDVQVFVVHGNHDPLAGWSAVSSWPPGVRVFGSTAVEAVPVEIDGRRAATVYGLSYARRETRDNLALRFGRVEGEGLHVGLLHASVGSNAEHAPYAPCSLSDLRASRLDYWALGHIHRRGELCRDPWVVYPGDTQGRSPKPAETGAKGALVVEVAGATVRAVRFVATDSVRFADRELDVGPLDDLVALRTAVLEAADEVRGLHEGRGLLVRLRLRGRGPVHRLLRAPRALEDLVEELRAEWRGASPFLWLESLRDETQSPLDREEIRRRGDFSAELIGVAQGLEHDPERREALLAELYAPLARGRAGRWVGPLAPGDDALELLRRAEGRALDLLEREEP
jgi:DNA repair exonuclease SbcCD nuclease subunit